VKHIFDIVTRWAAEDPTREALRSGAMGKVQKRVLRGPYRAGRARKVRGAPANEGARGGEGMNAGDNWHFSGMLRSAGAVVALTHLGCRGEPAPGPAISTSSIATSKQASSAAVAVPLLSASAPSPSAAPSVTAPPVTVAALRADAAANPARFKSLKVTLDGYFASRSQRRFGTEGHPVHSFVLVLVALGIGDSDTLTCEMSEETWPPAGLAPGDPISVSGVWSTDRILAGGSAGGGGPLQIESCKVARRPTDAPKNH
jgi:hypothetical protein